MPKITFMGAGSTVFAKSVLGDSLLVPSLTDAHIALYDIDATRLKESKFMLDILNKNINNGRARITAHLGVKNRRTALRRAQSHEYQSAIADRGSGRDAEKGQDLPGRDDGSAHGGRVDTRPDREPVQ